MCNSSLLLAWLRDGTLASGKGLWLCCGPAAAAAVWVTGTDDGRDCEEPSVASTQPPGWWLLLPSSCLRLSSREGGVCLWKEVEGSVVGVASASSLCLAGELCVDLAGEKNRRIIIQCN